MKDSDKSFIVWAVVAAIAFSVLATALSVATVEAPNGRRGVMSVIQNGKEYMAWTQTENGFVKTVNGGQTPDLDMAFAVAPVGQEVKNYIILKTDPNRIAENGEISAVGTSITVRWWETNVALLPSDPAYTIPFRAVSTNGGVTWSEPQNISDLPDSPAVLSVGAHRR